LFRFFFFCWPLSFGRVHHINKSAAKRVIEVVFICLLTGTAAVVLPAAFECRPEIRNIIMEDSAGCLNDADRFQISHGEMSHPYLVKLLTTAQLSGNCSATATTGGGSSRMLLEAAGNAASSAASSASSAAAPAISIADILKELAAHRHASSGAGSGAGSGTGSGSGSGAPLEDDVVWVDNNNKYIHLHYNHAYNCDKSKHEYNEMSMLWLNGGVKGNAVLPPSRCPCQLAVTNCCFVLPWFFSLEMHSFSVFLLLFSVAFHLLFVSC
jgi:hypothetical protein